MGRPKGSPNRHYDKEQARRIEELASQGVPFGVIEKVERLDNETRIRLYKEESDRGEARALLEAATILFEMVRDRDKTMLIFFLKTRGKGEYRETDRLELEHAESGDKKQIEELESRIVELNKKYRRDY